MRRRPARPLASLAGLGDFDAVRCSPLRRAARTAELLSAGAGLPAPVAVPGLQERGAGAWTGLTHEEIDARCPGARRDGRRPADYEPFEALLARVVAALRGLGDGRTLVVVHEGVLRALDDDPAPLPNLGARWFDAALRPVGPRLALAPHPADAGA